MSPAIPPAGERTPEIAVRLSFSILAAMALAGCSALPSPATAPAPAPVATAAEYHAPAVTGPSASTLDVVQAGHAQDVPAPVSPTEVQRQAVDVFGDSSILVDAPVLESRAAGPSWDIDVRSYETQERVAHYVSQFSGRSRKTITESLERGSRYEPMIRATMKAGGLPEDMYYLALVESGYDPNAYSRAAAVGMWQFMASTARGMGMRVDWWVDERRDPVRSTKAAVQFIGGLRHQFGSLYLAAAAYNGGPGRVARGLAKYADDVDTTSQREDAFFVLAEKDYLRNETREYVPQLIAAALVAKDPVRYGMEFHPRDAFAYDSVRVPARTPLAAVAKAAGATLAAVHELNPHILRGMTPPDSRMLVRIPVGTATQFDSGFRALSKDDRIATKTIETKRGQYPDDLAHSHGISLAALKGFNPKLRLLKPSGKLVPGQTLVLPTPAVAAAALNIPDPSIEKYSSASKKSSKSSKKGKAHSTKQGKTARLAATHKGGAAQAAKAAHAAKAAQAAKRGRKHSGAGSTAGARTKLLARAD
jgi:membrane-bound lytic murein transglycosylase D